MTLHEPRQHDEGVACACGRAWPCPKLTVAMLAEMPSDQFRRVTGVSANFPDEPLARAQDQARQRAQHQAPLGRVLGFAQDAQGLAIYVDSQAGTPEGDAGAMTDPITAGLDSPDVQAALDAYDNEVRTLQPESRQDARNAPRRRDYLGGPDVAAIVRVSRFAAPIDVWRAKVEGQERAATERMAWGLLLEDAVSQGYTAQTGLRLQKRRTPVMHRAYPFLGGSPDRWVVGEPGLLEIKVADWGAAWAEGIPPDVQVQCQWYLGLTGRLWADVAALHGLGRLEVTRIERDDALIADLEAEAVAFWRDHVLTGEAPDPDASPGYRKYLAEKYPSASELELVATPEQALTVDALLAIKADQKRLKAQRDEIEARIKTAMGDAGSLLGPGWRITWRNVKDGTEVDWQLIAQAYAKALIDVQGPAFEGWLDTIKGLYTRQTPGERRFTLTVKKGDD